MATCFPVFSSSCPLMSVYHHRLLPLASKLLPVACRPLSVVACWPPTLRCTSVAGGLSILRIGAQLGGV